jgi:hypothetical protein
MLDLTKAEQIFDNTYRIKDRGFIINFQSSNDLNKDFSHKPKGDWWIYNIELTFGSRSLTYPNNIYPRSISGGMSLGNAQLIVNENISLFLKHYFNDLL